MRRDCCLWIWRRVQAWVELLPVFPWVQLRALLRALLQALSVVASRLTIYEPAIPEIRIKTERSAKLVNIRRRSAPITFKMAAS